MGRGCWGMCGSSSEDCWSEEEEKFVDDAASCCDSFRVFAPEDTRDICCSQAPEVRDKEQPAGLGTSCRDKTSVPHPHWPAASGPCQGDAAGMEERLGRSATEEEAVSSASPHGSQVLLDLLHGQVALPPADSPSSTRVAPHVSAILPEEQVAQPAGSRRPCVVDMALEDGDEEGLDHSHHGEEEARENIHIDCLDPGAATRAKAVKMQLRHIPEKLQQ
mmetsp:Transcript_35730/g.111766  ORF Transcript_35730/g.111766 Transcript_35730/m.111766 type:complete len:219 (+) Transcript_35730:2825-3481(+)